MILKQNKIKLDRKELEIALQEDLEEEEDSALNLVETDGMLWPTFESWNVSLITIDDVWDDDSAYLELLAEQVKNYLLIPFS